MHGAAGDPYRAVVAAGFVAVVVHTMIYAAFLEDPVTWTLLGIGGALAWPRHRARSAPATSAQPPPAPGPEAVGAAARQTNRR